MPNKIELAFQELINKVEASQSRIDDLSMQVERLKLQLQSQKKLQEELEFYFILSQKQSKLLKESQILQDRAVELLVRLQGWVDCLSDLLSNDQKKPAFAGFGEVNWAEIVQAEPTPV